MDFVSFVLYSQFFTPELWLELIIGLLCFAIVFVFQSLALYTIAKREGYEHRWMAFVPFFSTYYIGVCSQKNKVLRVDTRKLSLIAAIIEVITVAAYIVYFVAEYLISDYVVYTYNDELIAGLPVDYTLVNYPANLKWAAFMFEYGYDYIITFLDLACSLFTIFILISFFKTYSSRRYLLFTIFSILFPIKGILFYVVKNNKGNNYSDFLRAEQERQFKAYQQYYSQNRNPYNNGPYNGNPYNGNTNNGNPYNNGSAADPFGDYSGNSNSNSNDQGGSAPGGDPFDEFKN